MAAYTNPSTPFDLDGHSAILAELQRLERMVTGLMGDLNASPQSVNQLTPDSSGLASAIVNATQMQGVPIALQTPTTGQPLTYNGQQWAPGSSFTGAQAFGFTSVNGAIASVDTTGGLSGTTWTCQAAGKYLLDAFVWANGFGGDIATLVIVKNGATTLVGTSYPIVGSAGAGGGVGGGPAPASVTLATGDTITLTAGTGLGTVTFTFGLHGLRIA